MVKNRGDALFRERVVIVCVNEEMRHPWMLRIVGVRFSRIAADLIWLA